MDKPLSPSNFLQARCSRNLVLHLVHEQGYKRRKPQKKRTMKQHADRNAQFDNIAKLKQEYISAHMPVISITKKKELFGNFYRDGVTDVVEPVIVNDHDFSSFGNGKLIPHGIYDIRRNEASLHLNTSYDTSEFSGESIALWWKEEGKSHYKNAKDLLILSDGGGSNSASSYLFKEDLQALSNRLGLNIRKALYGKNRNHQRSENCCPDYGQNFQNRAQICQKV